MTDTATGTQSQMRPDYVAPAATRIGHIHLKVADLDRAITFYRDLLGFELLYRLAGAAFLSAGGYHHHIALNTWESKGGSAPPAGTTGLYHFAINYPTRRDLAIAVKRLLDRDWQRFNGACEWDGVPDAELPAWFPAWYLLEHPAGRQSQTSATLLQSLLNDAERLLSVPGVR